MFSYSNKLIKINTFVSCLVASTHVCIIFFVYWSFKLFKLDQNFELKANVNVNSFGYSLAYKYI